MYSSAAYALHENESCIMSSSHQFRDMMRRAGQKWSTILEKKIVILNSPSVKLPRKNMVASVNIVCPFH